MFSLAQRAALPHAKALKLHRQQYPAAFERVIVRQGEHIRYYSDHDATLYGEYVATQLDFTPPSNEDADAQRFTLYAEKRDESLWYMAAYQGGHLTQEGCHPLPALLVQFGYALHHARQVFVTDDEFRAHYEHASRCQTVDTSHWSPDALKAFVLTPVTRRRLSRSALLALLITTVLAGGGLTYHQLTKPKPVVRTKAQMVSDKYLSQHQRRMVNAHQALLNARNRLVEAMVMPNGVSADQVVLDQQSLVMRVVKKDLKASMVYHWLRTHPELAKAFQKPNFVIPLDAPPPWQSWKTTGYHRLLTESVERLGGTIHTERTTVINGIPVTSYRILTSGHLGHVTILADVLNAPFVALSQLSLTNTDQSIKVDVQIDVQGEPLS